MGEIIQIHVGQAGVQIANACWELYCLEHGIKADGSLCDCCPNDDTFKNFFSFKDEDKVVPRAILVDSEPTVIDQVRTGPYGQLYSPGSLITGKEDSGSNFARGYYTMGAELIDVTMEAIRVIAESCCNLKGFLLFRSIGGGTGSGLGNLIVEQLKEEYEKVSKLEFIIFPSPSMSPLIVEPYNALLSTHFGMDSIECSFILDNEALYDICSSKLNICAPKYKNLNRIIGQTVSTFTTSQRFAGSSSVSFAEFQTNLVPYPRIHFPLVSYSPFIAGTGSGCTNLTTEQITNACFEPSSQLVRCNPADGKYMSCVLLYRGKVSTAYINSSLSNLKDCQSVRFVDWQPTGFKVEMNKEPPFTVPCGGLSSSNKALLALSNNTIIHKAWCRLIEKCNRLYSRRAFVHHYIAEGLEDDAISEALEDIRALVADYNEVDKAENTEDISARVKGCYSGSSGNGGQGGGNSQSWCSLNTPDKPAKNSSGDHGKSCCPNERPRCPQTDLPPYNKTSDHPCSVNANHNPPLPKKSSVDPCCASTEKLRKVTSFSKEGCESAISPALNCPFCGSPNTEPQKSMISSCPGEGCGSSDSSTSLISEGNCGRGLALALRKWSVDELPAQKSKSCQDVCETKPVGELHRRSKSHEPKSNEGLGRKQPRKAKHYQYFDQGFNTEACRAKKRFSRSCKEELQSSCSPKCRGPGTGCRCCPGEVLRLPPPRPAGKEILGEALTAKERFCNSTCKPQRCEKPERICCKDLVVTNPCNTCCSPVLNIYENSCECPSPPKCCCGYDNACCSPKDHCCKDPCECSKSPTCCYGCENPCCHPRDTCCKDPCPKSPNCCYGCEEPCCLKRDSCCDNPCVVLNSPQCCSDCKEACCCNCYDDEQCCSPRQICKDRCPDNIHWVVKTSKCAARVERPKCFCCQDDDDLFFVNSDHKLPPVCCRLRKNAQNSCHCFCNNEVDGIFCPSSAVLLLPQCCPSYRACYQEEEILWCPSTNRICECFPECKSVIRPNMATQSNAPIQCDNNGDLRAKPRLPNAVKRK